MTEQSKHELSEKDAEIWRKCADQLRTAHEAVSDVQVTLLTKLGITAGAPLERVEQVLENLGGLSYLFTPQTTWKGGDSSDPKNFYSRPPHILDTPLVVKRPRIVGVNMDGFATIPDFTSHIQTLRADNNTLVILVSGATYLGVLIPPGMLRDLALQTVMAAANGVVAAPAAVVDP